MDVNPLVQIVMTTGDALRESSGTPRRRYTGGLSSLFGVTQREVHAGGDAH
jgi:hypothetical protein